MAAFDPKKFTQQTCGLPEAHMVPPPPSLLIPPASVKSNPLKSHRIGPSPLRQLLPIAVCLLSFATVLSMLIVYMDTTGNYKRDFYFYLQNLILFYTNSTKQNKIHLIASIFLIILICEFIKK